MSTRAALLFAVTGPLCAVAWGQAPGYTMVDLGGLPQGGWSVACGINNPGQVVGYSFSGAPWDPVRPFIWDPLRGIAEPDTAGWHVVVPNRISDAGQIVGFCSTGRLWEDGQRAMFWDPTSGPQALPNPPYPYSVSFASAEGINDWGQVVGWGGQRPPEPAVLWSPDSGGMQVLPGLWDWWLERAYAINNSGVVVGFSGRYYGPAQPVFWTPPQMSVVALPRLIGGYGAYAYDINNAGQAVGYCESVSGTGDHACLWDTTQSPPVVMDLGAVAVGIGVTLSRALAINDSGVVVGWANIGRHEDHACVWDTSASPITVSDLGRLPGPAGQSGYSYAYDVNNAGQIVGESMAVPQLPHAVLWQPAPPAAADAGPDQVVEQASRAGADVTLDASASTGQGLTYTWTEDTSDGEVIVAGPTVDAITTATLQLGVHAVDLTVCDQGSNSDTDGVTVVVADTTAPTIAAPAGVDAWEADPRGTAVELGAPTVTDACDARPAVGHNAPALFVLGTTTVTWTATDGSGNSTSATQQVVILPGSALNQLANLAKVIRYGVNDGKVAPEIEGALLAKLDAARAALIAGNPNAAKVAISDLKALVNQVEAQVDRKIAPDVAADIIARANRIIAALGG